MRALKTGHWVAMAAAFVAISAFIGFLAIGLKKSGTPIPSQQIGKPAKDFVIPVVQDPAGHRELRLSDYRGKGVILNFWASWCHSCRDEARDLEKLWQRVQGSDLVVVGIAIQDSIAAAKAFANDYGKTYALGLDESGSVSIDYGITGVPETFFISKDGLILHKEAMPLDVKTLASMAEKLRQGVSF